MRSFEHVAHSLKYIPSQPHLPGKNWVGLLPQHCLAVRVKHNHHDPMLHHCYPCTWRVASMADLGDHLASGAMINKLCALGHCDILYTAHVLSKIQMIFMFNCVDCICRVFIWHDDVHAYSTTWCSYELCNVVISFIIMLYWHQWTMKMGRLWKLVMQSCGRQLIKLWVAQHQVCIACEACFTLQLCLRSHGAAQVVFYLWGFPAISWKSWSHLKKWRNM